MAKNKIEIFEVGPRDGLQNEQMLLSLENKITFIEGLIDSGLSRIEIGSFVRPDFVPQMANTDKLYLELQKNKFIKRSKKIELWSLVPNLSGLERAHKVDIKNIALFTAVTNGFTKKNIGMSVSKSLKVFKEIIEQAQVKKIRAYLSTAFGCPYDGKVSAKKTLKMIENLCKLGAHEISIGDTIGVADPNSIKEVIKPALKNFGARKIALHCHDTRGTALANVLRAYELGVRVFDSSAGGLGGCPYAPGASGNLATEDLVYMMEKMGVRTGVDIDKLSQVSINLSKIMKKQVSSKVVQAYINSKSKNRKWI